MCNFLRVELLDEFMRFLMRCRSLVDGEGAGAAEKVSLSRTRLWVVMQYCKCWFYCCSCEKACKGDLLTS